MLHDMHSSTSYNKQMHKLNCKQNRLNSRRNNDCIRMCNELKKYSLNGSSGGQISVNLETRRWVRGAISPLNLSKNEVINTLHTNMGHNNLDTK